MNFAPVIPWWALGAAVLACAAGAGYIWWRNGRPRKIHLPATWARRLLLVVLILIMALGPEVPGGHSSPGLTNLDVLFVVDTTESMGALDYNGDNMRLDGVKKDILALAKKLSGARFALVSFDSSAHLLMPYTSDASALTNAVAGMNREVYVDSHGSSIDQPIAMMKSELIKSQQQHPNRGRLVFYMGDGEQTVKAAVKTFAPVAPLMKGGAVLGYGTPQGGKMLKYTGFMSINNGQDTQDAFSSKYVETLDLKSFDYVPAISKIDEAALKKIASQLNVPYMNRNSGGPVDNLFDASHAQVVADHSREVDTYLHLYWIFAFFFAFLLLWELDDLVRELKRTRPAKEPAA